MAVQYGPYYVHLQLTQISAYMLITKNVMHKESKSSTQSLAPSFLVSFICYRKKIAKTIAILMMVTIREQINLR